MPPANFRSLTVSTSTAERVQRLQAELKKKGSESVPATLREGLGDEATVSFVVETALNALEAAMKKGVRP